METPMLQSLSPLKALFLFVALTLLFGCQRLPLKIESDYISRENLASYHIRTPDPLLNNPPVGQRLILTWAVPKKLFTSRSLHIAITILYGDHTQEVKIITPHRPGGINITYLLNDEYFDKCGILTYKAELFCGTTLLYQWRHKLWTELITFPDEEL